MYFTFEISRPAQYRFWYFKSRLTTRFGFLWFAFGFHPMREDQMHQMIASGSAVWRDR